MVHHVLLYITMFNFKNEHEFQYKPMKKNMAGYKLMLETM